MSGLEIFLVVTASYMSVFIGLPIMILALNYAGYEFQLVIEKKLDLGGFDGDDDDGDWEQSFEPQDGGGNSRTCYLNNPEYYDWMQN